MRHAPSVIYPVGRCAFWGQLLALCGLLLVAVLVIGWSGLTRWQATGLALALLAWFLSAAWAVWCQPEGWLRFSVSPAPLPGDTAWSWLVKPGGDALPLNTPRIVLDLQQRLLLQAGGSAAVPRWIWLEARLAPADWLALRRALRVNTGR